jgi:hypothetical protein
MDGLSRRAGESSPCFQKSRNKPVDLAFSVRSRCLFVIMFFVFQCHTRERRCKQQDVGRVFPYRRIGMATQWLKLFRCEGVTEVLKA